MKPQTYKKTDLLTILRENKTKHREVYEAALAGYKAAAHEWFTTQLERFQEGEQFATVFSSPRPEDHTDDYDNVIRMLELCVDDDILLDENDFIQYIQDDWGWKKQWTTTNSAYLS